MENLDIEKLERKNIYQLQDDVIEKMQEKVLERTLPLKQGKIIKLNWIYSAAAAISLLFGLTFFINNDQKEGTNNSVAQTSSNVEQNVEINTLPSDNIVSQPIENTNKEIVPQVVETAQIKNIEKNSFAINSEKPIQTSKQVSTKKVQKAEIPMDQIIASFTTADLADLGKNTEQDIYLDLYN